MSDQKQPNVRFAGFDDAWELRKLDEVAEFKDNLRIPVTKSDRISGNIPYYGANGIQDYVKGYTHNGEFVLIAEDGANDVMNYPVHYVSGKVWVNNHAHVITGKNEVLDNLYLSSLIKSMNISSWLVGGGRAKLNGEILKKIPINLPTLDEQREIGTFFKGIDRLIAANQRQLEQLKTIKKLAMQKIFDQEWRFKGYTDPWEPRKFFNNIKRTIDFRGRTPKKLGMEWSEKGHLALSALNVKNGYIDKSVNAHYADENLYQKWMTGNELEKGQVLFTTEAPMGNVAQIPDNEKYVLSQRTIAFEVLDNEITNDFLAVILSSKNVFNRLQTLSSGATAKGVSQKSLAQLLITVPNSLKEQTRIGIFFKSLDSLIAANQSKSEQLKKLKKWFMQNMFI
ncbi:Type I restriction-modification system, specificity subunit S [Pediococcus damnosus]|uniref:Type I restriction-modification system, specificity subunit S n=1 Tax=Pediococcus damnosus TaxID=51663 RepID=A0A0R2HJL5_9LACO|nr:restriction endonuclease subunit S [Pediococcus damnosus]AMV63272.1 Type I restriction-modification system, specificity subunit S [Pediococcus damnosus]AMV66832.1 Type I restriction-modification system, specificity subunit S [Pediococcus damnosus]KRN53202.1 type i restriction enzyme specificity protein [Pediococcus damnosus]PJE48963.1 restriction endonuclease subunit S [Pediococcus damnosus]GEA93209.1 hypothetical protein PDA01_11020 [Pediococcus damnosus]